jgi:type I restriction enzyme S subunit
VLLEGLECSEVKWSKVKAAAGYCRCEAEFFRKEFLTSPLSLDKGKLLEDIANIQSGTTPPDREEGLSHGVVLLKTTDIRNRPLDRGGSYYFISSAIAHRMRKTALRTGDVLINIVGATTDVIGRAGFIPPNFPEANITQAMALLRLRDKTWGKPEVLFSFLLSKYGNAQARRYARQTGQYNLNLRELARFRIPALTGDFQEKVAHLIAACSELQMESSKALKHAESLLLDSLGLQTWPSTDPLTYTQIASVVFGSGRWDAAFFSPRVAELFLRLRKSGLVIGDVAPLRQEQFTAGGAAEFEYIEIGDVKSDGSVTTTSLRGLEAPSRAAWFVRTSDVITSTVRPIRRLTAIIDAEQSGAVCSSGFVVLKPQSVAPEVLLTYLRLPAVCELMDLHTSASMYPAISERDLLNIPFRRVESSIEADIVTAVRASRAAKWQAQLVLERAKKAIEIVIEQNEDAALNYLAKGND